jgi:hypothetical protein
LIRRSSSGGSALRLPKPEIPAGRLLNQRLLLRSRRRAADVDDLATQASKPVIELHQLGVALPQQNARPDVRRLVDQTTLVNPQAGDLLWPSGRLLLVIVAA